MHSCDVVCPDLRVPCGSRPHGPGVAHHASGTAADGTRWSLFWWQPGEVVELPVTGAAAPALPGSPPGSPPGRPGRPTA